MKFYLVGVVLAVASLGREAAARPAHQGFTGDLGFGVSLTTSPRDVYSARCGSAGGCVSSTRTEHESHFGLASLSLTLGGFDQVRRPVPRRA